MAYRCGAVTADGTACRRTVQTRGGRCPSHAGVTFVLSNARIPRQRDDALAHAQGPKRRPISAAEDDLLRRAAAYCADAMTADALSVVELRAIDYVSTGTWDRIGRSWGARNCRALAEEARAILDGKRKVHRVVGYVVGRVVALVGGSRLAQALSDEIAARVALPFVDHYAVIAARGLQVAGLVMCVLHGQPVVSCACFKDVVMAEGKERMNAMLVAAADDWSGFRRFETPATSTLATARITPESGSTPS